MTNAIQQLHYSQQYGRMVSMKVHTKQQGTKLNIFIDLTKKFIYYYGSQIHKRSHYSYTETQKCCYSLAFNVSLNDHTIELSKK